MEKSMSEASAVRDLDYFMSEEHADEFGKLTEEQQAALYTNGQLEGETAIIDTPADVTKEASQAVVAEPEKEPVVQAKDGVHTIPFKELEDAREKARYFEQLSSEQKTLLDDLAKAKEQDAKTGGDEAQQAVMAEYTGEFPEVAQDMKPFIQAMIDTGVKAQMAALEAKMNGIVAPIQKMEEDSAAKAHFDSIRSKHADFDTVVQGDTLSKWVETKPSFIQNAMKAVLESGTATQVIELSDAYKTDKPVAPVQTNASQVAAEAIAKAKAAGAAPKSLSAFPGAGQAHVDEAEAMQNMSPNELALKFEGKSQGDILKMLSRLV